MNIMLERVGGDFFQNLKHPVEFVFIRHGESEGNANGVFQGLLDYPLTDRGREQARLRGRQLQALPFCSKPDLVGLYTSPMGRARETAELIAESAGFVKPQVVPSLTELDTGVWTGKAWADVKSETNDLWPHFRSKSWAAIPEAESETALYDRALASWAFLRDQAIEHNLHGVIAVSHAGFLQWLFRVTFGCRSWFPLIPVHNCGMFRFKVEPIGKQHSPYVAWDTINEPLPASL
jgi:broad specificity phosphatase PhoE